MRNVDGEEPDWSLGHRRHQLLADLEDGILLVEVVDESSASGRVDRMLQRLKKFSRRVFLRFVQVGHWPVPARSDLQAIISHFFNLTGSSLLNDIGDIRISSIKILELPGIKPGAAGCGSKFANYCAILYCYTDPPTHVCELK